jgi:elongation factor Ts
VDVPIEKIKELRSISGAGVMDCRNALASCSGDTEKALEKLREAGLAKAAKKAERATTQGLVETYIHGGRIGAMVELGCESDFVARTQEFKELAHILAMQIAAMSPTYISTEELTEGSGLEPAVVCLLAQPYIKDTTRTVKDIINETIAKVGENIRVNHFARFEIGGQAIMK